MTRRLASRHFLTVAITLMSAWGIAAAGRSDEQGASSGLPTYEKKSTWAETMLSLRVPVEEEAEPTAPQLWAWFTTGNLKSDRFDEVLFPEDAVELDAKGDDGRRLWEARPDWADGRPHDLPSDGGRGATYLYRTIRVEQPVELPVGLGSDDGLLVWLNGEEVLRRDVARGVSPNQDRAVLSLEPGENRLLLKIYNQGGGHGFYFSTDPLPEGDLLGDLWKRIEADFPIECGWMRRHLGGQTHLGYFDFHRDADLERRMIEQALRECGRDGTSLRGRFEALASAGAGPDDPRWLALYEEICLFRHRPDALRQINLRALRLAIEDLAGTFGGRYSKGREHLARLEQIEREVARIERDLAGGDQRAAGRAAGVVENFRRLQQEALLANPLLDFGRLLVIPRAANKHLGLPQNWQGNCALPRNGYDNRIAVLSPIRPDGKLTSLYQPDGERFVGDIDLHFDGRRMLFSMPGEHNRWQVWEIGVDGSGLRQVTPGEEPDVDNYDGCYLPDGRILFASTRCFQGVPCVGGGNTVANLCIMNADGTGIRQLCFDQDHNWGPTVLNDGRVLYARWEYSDTPHYFSRLLFRMNPDGTGQMQYYGSNSHWPNSLFYARPIPNHPTKVVAVVSGHHGVPRMGELVLFDPARGRYQADGAVQRIPGHGVKVEPVIGDGIVDRSWPKFLHPYPLSDKYFLVSMKPDEQSDWGIYLVDVFDNLVPVKVERGRALFQPVPLRSRPRPPVIPDRVDLLATEATVYLNDVYFGEGLAGVPRGTVKSLRLYEFHYAYPGMGGHIDIGIDGPWDARRILGTVPVESDGSAAFKVPANVPIAVQPLDAQGRAVQVMRSWFTAMPGEVLSCTGCHEDLNTAPPPKTSAAMLRRPSAIAPWRGPARPFSFRREVQPVLDKHCVGCHDGKNGGRPIFTADRPSPFRRFTPSYVELHPFVRRPGPESDYALQRPMEFHASTSELVQMLETGHHGVALDAEAWDRLVTWIDLNVPDHGTWTEQRGGKSHWIERRLEMRAKYANRPENPEEYPTPPPETPEFVRPAPPPERRPQTFQMTGWPFDAAEAERRREALGLPKELSVELAEGLALEMVLIPPGEFVMGAHDGLPDEYPQTRVVIDKPFYLGRFEVTNAQYALFDAGHDSAYISVYNKDHSNRGRPVNQDRQPVVRVSWRQAMDYCRWLSRTTGRRFTLPTESQWEYSCRAGTTSPLWYGGTRTDFGKLANLADVRLNELAIRDSPKWIPSVPEVNDGAIVTEQVGKYQPNAFGLFDMHGNAAEWTRTEYRPYPYNAGDGREQPSARGTKVVRGGSFHDRPERARSAARRRYPPWQQVFDVGFRVAMEIDP
jgi:formylglycine-generating enzyme required for sulfatase activity